MKKFSHASLFICAILLACTNNEGLTTKEVTSGLDTVKGPNLEKDIKDAINKAVKNPSTRTLNGIQLEVTGINVSSAYLIYGDDESLVPSSNTTTLGRPVKMRLMIADGWTIENNQISIGASERIETDNNLLVLNAEDMFKNNPTMPAAYGGQISLKAVITEMEKTYEYFNVYFRVWDKKGSGEIKGSYKLYIK